MPISRYYGGHGSEVMESMKRTYGPEEGERVFYATANKKHQKPKDSKMKKHMKQAACGE